MKKLNKITLGEGMRVLSDPELKHLKGGNRYYYCHCKGNTGEGKSASSCDDCKELCGSAGVQNCNYTEG